MAETIEQLLSASAARYPERTAVYQGSVQLSYRELNERADRLALGLQARGCGPDCRIGICVPKSGDFVAALFAVLRTGAAYVPLDPEAPAERLRRIIAQCEPLAVIVDSPVGSELNATLEPVPLWPLSRLAAAGAPAQRLQRHEPSADELAYILYTSGSTGQPKGVAISHRACRAFLDWSFDEFALAATDRFISLAPFTFDLSVFDIFNCIRCGGTLHIVPPTLLLLPKKLADYAYDQQISIWYSVPWVIANLVSLGRLERYAGQPWPVRLMLFAGEVFPIEQLTSAVAALAPARFYNLFGPTETNVCTYYRLPRKLDDLAKPVPIGRACSGDTVYVLDDDDRLIEDDGIGQLLVGGASLMSGYFRMPDATAQVMLASHPELGPGPFYRTGDLVARRADGNLEFYGRRDSLVKRRGYRIELGEIEHAAGQHPAVHEVAAVASTVPTGTTIRLFVVCRADVAATQLRHFLIERIPLYMLPDSIALLPRLPRTPNGKIDRAKLAQP